jgi:hypothetical protein
MHRDRLPPRRRFGPGGTLIAAAASSACCFGFAAPTALAQVRPADAAAARGPVGTAPAKGTPQLKKTGRTEQIRQLVQCGNTMYAVGNFTEIQRNSSSYARNNVFSFSATSPYQVTSWNPNVNGVVNSIALSSDCKHAYIGGAFSRVGGATANNVAEISTSTGALDHQFAHDANNVVNTVLVTPNGHLLVGGEFTGVNGSGADAFYASLNLSTGRNDGYLSLSVTGHYQFPGADPSHTEIFNQQLSPNGSDVLAEGVFTSVGGLPRQQIFMLRLGSSGGTVTGWNSTEFNRHCVNNHPLYVKTATWSPDGSTIYVATTGLHAHNWKKGNFPLTGLCDAASAWPATQAGGLKPTWVNYDGCYTLLSVAAGSTAVYIGGHELYGNNRDGCKSAGPGAVPDPGLGGLNPGNGRLIVDSAGTAGRYSRSRGLGADDLLLTSAGLWVASDNLDGSAMCDGVFGHAGICFLPYK